jgi:hypothetical protein
VNEGHEIAAESALAALRALGRAPGARLLPVEELLLELIPREEGLAKKDVPVEALLKKITSMRDKLRVLEQRVNADDQVGTVERAALQQQITAVYDAFAGLTAFFSEDALPAAPTPTPTPTPNGAA